MGKLKVIDFVVYRWRYGLGYIGVSILLVVLLIVAGLFVPDGITKHEIASTVTSSNFSIKHFSPDMIINAPYHILQKISFILFGVSNLSIKLPSLIIAFFSAIGMLFLLRSWFKQNVAVLTALIVVTTGQFLLVAQTGTPYILYIFWSVWLLLCASMISQQSRFLLGWKILLFVIIAFSIYTPLSAYIILALTVAVILHPHLRYMIMHLSKLSLLVASCAGLIIISPIIYAAVLQPSIIIQLLGIPSSMPPLADNARYLFSTYFDFLHPANGIVMSPIYGLTPMLLIIIGFFRMLTTKYTAKSYIVSGWLILLVPVLLLNPTAVSITFVPFLILLAVGIDYLIRYWYRLFPANPYARAAGLIPLVILIASVTFSGLERFMYGYSYGRGTASSFSKDVSLLRTELAQESESRVLRVTPSELAFYTAFNKYRDTSDLTVTSKPSASASTLIVSRAARQATDALTPTKIITGPYIQDADRFYVYKKSVD